MTENYGFEKTYPEHKLHFLAAFIVLNLAIHPQLLQQS